MQRVIGRKLYDTDTAEELASYGEGYGGDFRAFYETLYRTKNGALFMYGEGGPMSPYAKSYGAGGWNNGGEITPLTIDEGLDWCEKHDKIDVMEKIDPNAITEA